MPSTILLPGTLDTKGEEYAWVRERIRGAGHEVLVMDLGILDAPPFPPDVSAAEVARAGGGDLTELRARGDRGQAVEVMQRGAAALVAEMHAAGRFQGVLGLGGGGGTSMITAAMRTLPVGVPKVMVSTMASGDTAPYVDVKDITMMYSVVDIAGLNPISRQILANAVGAICGMVAQGAGLQASGVQASGVQGPLDGEEGQPAAPPSTHPSAGPSARPLVAATMFGVTTPCVTAVRKGLEAAGHDVVVFHATGTGGRAMEGLVDDGFISAVVDVTTTEWCDEVVGGVLSAGPDRLSAAGRRGIPQVVSVGALDMVNFGAADTVPDRFRDRRLYRHNPQVTLMRTTPTECEEIGRRIAARLNEAAGPVVLALPLRGVSMLDAEGQPFHDPEADRALFDSLRRHVEPGVRILEVDAHINDPEFAEALVAETLALLRSPPRDTDPSHAQNRG